jgi:crotonobetaine/carnitine-CoA ligase
MTDVIRAIRFAELNRLTNRAASGLAALGVKSGVGVSTMLPNTPEWLFVYFATQKLGAYAVPVNVALVGEGLRHVIDHSDSSVLVRHPDHREAIEAISLDKLQRVVVDTRDAPEGWAPPPDWLTLAQVMETSEDDPGVVIPGEAISTLMYTSGTTGAPKGVVNRYLEFSDALPKTETHRVQKSVLKRTGVGPKTFDRETRSV